jgi:hypothetical protein
MKTLTTLFFLLCGLTIFPQHLLTPFEKNNLTTTTYEECIEYYRKLDSEYNSILLTEAGETDIGRPLHLVIISRNEKFEPEELLSSGRVIFLINNGIHPGEPDGIDASMMLARDIAREGVPENVVILIIPVYNVDGMLNRNNFTRVNQNGPLEYGFRGNAQNMDLNRDFIKCDTRNARSFVSIFRKWKPHLFVDTHTTNGADYPYVMTYIATQKDKLNSVLSDYLVNTLIPHLENDMYRKNYPIVPYVYNYSNMSYNAITGFMESPRYSSGYASLFNCIGFISESHMLKTHAERVYATYEFLKSLIKIADEDHEKIIENKIKADSITVNIKSYVTSYVLDTTRYQSILFSGYEAKYKPSNISGYDRLYYDKSSPYKEHIRFYNDYIPVNPRTRPLAYIVPQAWHKVIQLLELNKVVMHRLTEDMEYLTETYYIESFETRNPPFEGHYLHSNVKLKVISQKRKFYKGDYIIYTSQEANQFIMHVLEPECPDSYFNWNFFDAILQQKEYFEPYLFEDIADSLLNSRADLRKEFELKKLNDEKFREDPYAQLKFIYDNTIREPEFMRYPVARIISE